ncbi:MAG: hypothetical protein AAF849_16020 [Bacteroidota bacterium]
MTETKDMTFNEIATIRNILVGKEMGNLEGDLAMLKKQLSADLDEIRTAIDNINKKIEHVKQQSEERFDQLEQLLNASDKNRRVELADIKQKNRQELSDAFLQLSNIFVDQETQ